VCVRATPFRLASGDAGNVKGKMQSAALQKSVQGEVQMRLTVKPAVIRSLALARSCKSRAGTCRVQAFWHQMAEGPRLPPTACSHGRSPRLPPWLMDAPNNSRHNSSKVKCFRRMKAARDQQGQHCCVSATSARQRGASGLPFLLFSYWTCSPSWHHAIKTRRGIQSCRQAVAGPDMLTLWQHGPRLLPLLSLHRRFRAAIAFASSPI